MISRFVPTAGAYNLRGTLAPTKSGRDPSIKVASGAWRRASWTPDGAATLSLKRVDGGVDVTGWGPGAEWAVEQSPELLGMSDNLEDFTPPASLAEVHRRNPGIRYCKTRRVLEVILRYIPAQRVTGKEAVQTYNHMCWKYGEPAPGPLDLRMPPDPTRLRHMTYPEAHLLGMDRRRAETMIECCRRAKRLEEASEMTSLDAQRRIRAIQGLGVWTAAHVREVAWGDADAVHVGDYHLKNVVTYALTGRARGTDEEMVELLEPFRPHRGRIVRLIAAAGIKAPVFGPRQAINPIKEW